MEEEAAAVPLAVQMAAAAQPEQPKVPSLSFSLSPSHGPLTAPEAETVPTAAADAVEVVEVAPHDGGAAELNSCTPTHVHDREERGERGRLFHSPEVSFVVMECLNN